MTVYGGEILRMTVLKTRHVILALSPFPSFSDVLFFPSFSRVSAGISRKKRTDSKLLGIPEIGDFEDDVVWWGDFEDDGAKNKIRHSRTQSGNLAKHGTSFLFDKSTPSLNGQKITLC